jgi:hypothetical protein
MYLAVTMLRALLSLTVIACLGVTACLSAEMSEASQLSRLERGIDNSTTATDRTLTRGETPVAGNTVAAEPLAAPPTLMPPADPPRTEALLEPEETAPRPTIRVWGAPGGHGTAAIVYGDAGAKASPTEK